MPRPMQAASYRMRAAAALLLGLALLTPAVRAQQTFRAPESIKIGLGMLDRVVADTARLIATQNFAQLPRESDQLEAGIAALQQGVGDGPTPLRKQMEPLLGRARIAASAMAEAARSRRTSMLPVAHDQLASAVRSLIALFPPALRPAPTSR